jgi:adenine-specific DNA-methyltransferase
MCRNSETKVSQLLDPSSDRPSLITMAFEQTTLIQDEAYEVALAMSELESDQEYGAVFTKRWVVELILDLVGYTADRDLAAMRVVEPACGDGAFLGPVADRLIESAKSHGRDLRMATEAIRACDLQPAHVKTSRLLIEDRLRTAGLFDVDAAMLADAWVSHDDFLLSQHEVGAADVVVGNPPYIRLEAVPAVLTDAYRRVCKTMGGRSDVFVGFFEVGLKALRPDGRLGFICADRWMRNQYGQRLRSLIESDFSVEATIEMHDVEAFDADVSAYPSVTILRRGQQGRSVLATARAGFDADAARRVHIWSKTDNDQVLSDAFVDAARLPGWFKAAGGSWPTGSPERLALLAELESSLPTLEDGITGTKVGIGVATGADKVFVIKQTGLVEDDRELPLAMARDTMSGTLKWSGHHLVDPWDADTGKLVELDAYPRLADYFEVHAPALLKRNVAGRRPAQWYRTIDRVDHALLRRPKLFFPDIKAAIHPVLDDGQLYPHHNLYWVASSRWDPEVLGGILLSKVAQLFIEAYAVKMRGGYLRFQAQYLRRIRVPLLDSLAGDVSAELAQAFRERDVERATAAALAAYRIRSLPR